MAKGIRRLTYWTRREYEKKKTDVLFFKRFPRELRNDRSLFTRKRKRLLRAWAYWLGILGGVGGGSAAVPLDVKIVNDVVF